MFILTSVQLLEDHPSSIKHVHVFQGAIQKKVYSLQMHFEEPLSLVHSSIARCANKLLLINTA